MAEDPIEHPQRRRRRRRHRSRRQRLLSSIRSQRGKIAIVLAALAVSGVAILVVLLTGGSSSDGSKREQGLAQAPRAATVQTPVPLAAQGTSGAQAAQASVVAGSPAAAPPAAGQPSSVRENSLPGKTDWQVLARQGPGIVEGFATETSVNAGGTIGIALSARDSGTASLAVYRMGWYGGAGARMMLSVPSVPVPAQGYWPPDAWGLTNCRSCTTDPATGLLDTGWQPAYTLTVPADWVSGVYVVQVGNQAGVNYLSFIVRDDRRQSDVLLVSPDNTTQAYNQWGGKSLYGGVGPITVAGTTQAVKVSFNRPVLDAMGTYPGRLNEVIQTVRFFERRGYDVTYASSTDVDRDASIVRNHKVVVSLGHDEYWTRAMRDNVEAARDAGINLVFLGGNDVYWQTRYEPDAAGHAQRTMVMYRSAVIDPASQTDPQQTTVQFVDAPLNRPQSSLTGTLYAGGLVNPVAVPWVVAPTAPDWLLAGTGLQPGNGVPGVTADECDRVSDNGRQPPGLLVVASSPATTTNGPGTCNSTFYTAPSGAGVFSAGTRGWTEAMDSFGFHYPTEAASAAIQRLMENLFQHFGVSAATP